MAGIFLERSVKKTNSCKPLSKETKIKREITRLKRVYENLDKNQMKVIDTLIKRAAFLTVSLAELEEIINREGYESEYHNGANQSGTKQSESVKSHIAMTRNLAAIVRQLAELAPPAAKHKSKLQAFRDGS